jgi:hypothetical protein
LFLPVLNVVSYRLIAELNSTSDGFGINFSGFDFRENRLCTFQETLFDIFACFSTCFEENQIIVLGKIAGFEESDFARFLQILFVAYEDYYYVW